MIIGMNDLEDFVRGAAFFGTGGGGDPYIGRLMVEKELLSAGNIDIIQVDELCDDAFVLPVGCMGAPTVMTEKLPSASALEYVLKKMEKIMSRKVDAIIPFEIGGINSVMPLVLAARTGLPVVNADGMGRAFPEIQMVTFGVYGCDISPMVISNEQGDTVTLDTHSNLQAEGYARSMVIKMGGQAQIGIYPMNGREVKQSCVPGTLEQARMVGQTIRESIAGGSDPFVSLKALFQDQQEARIFEVLFDGKIISVNRELKGGFTVGEVELEGIGEQRGLFKVVFQNENLIAYKNGQAVAMVPDLITIMDRETAEPLTTDNLKYGQRVKIVALSANRVMKTEQALAVFGPSCFGLSETFRPIGEQV
jgi:DUF917 family protein